MGRRRQAIAFAIVATGVAGVACGSLLGGDQDDVPPTALVVDAASDEAATAVSADASELPRDEGGCHPPEIVDNGSRALYGYRSTTTKTLDGVLDDFSSTCPTYVLTRATTAYIVEEDGGFGNPTAKVFVEWEPDTMWIGIDVSGLSPTVYDAGIADADTDADADASLPDPRLNDSIEVYISASPDQRDGDGYKTPREHQYIIDFLGSAVAYEGQTNDPKLFANTRSTARANGYTVEMKLGSDVLAPFFLGRKLAFDLLLNVGTGQRNYGFLGLELHAVCAYPCTSYCTCNVPAGSGGDTPAFDTLLYPPLTLR